MLQYSPTFIICLQILPPVQDPWSSAVVAPLLEAAIVQERESSTPSSTPDILRSPEVKPSCKRKLQFDGPVADGMQALLQLSDSSPRASLERLSVSHDAAAWTASSHGKSHCHIFVLHPMRMRKLLQAHYQVLFINHRFPLPLSPVVQLTLASHRRSRLANLLTGFSTPLLSTLLARLLQ